MQLPGLVGMVRADSSTHTLSIQAPVRTEEDSIVSAKKIGDRKAEKKNKDADPSQKEEDDVEAGVNALMSEIESGLRDDQLQELWDRYRNLGIACFAALILGVSGYQYMESLEIKRIENQAIAYSDAAEQIAAGNMDQALSGLAVVAEQGGNYGALAQLQRASIYLEQDNKADALAIYRSLSEDLSIEPSFADLAALLWVLHGMDIEDPASLEDRLLPLTSPSNAYSHTALELLAVLTAKQGDTVEALAILDDLLEDSNTPGTIRARAEELKAVYQSPLSPGSVSQTSILDEPSAPNTDGSDIPSESP